MSQITLITPCFNGEDYIQNYINGLLSQTAKNVEYIFVNDGSTDKTKEIIMSYKNDFLEKGWNFKYIEQENCGQAAAINNALKIMTGDYFSCIDSDDILMPEFLEKMSYCLENNSEVDMVFPVVELVKEKTLEHIAYQERKVPKRVIDTLFSDMLLKSDNLPIFPSFMIRKTSFEKYNPAKKIYEGYSGQNPQLILPIAYNGKVAYLSECLLKYVVRTNSDSHSNLIDKITNWEDIYCKTLKDIPNMPDYEKSYYFNKIKERWSKAAEKQKSKDKSKRIILKMFGVKISLRLPCFVKK